MASALDRMNSKRKTQMDSMTSANEKVYLSDLLGMADLSDGEWHTFRMVHAPYAYGIHWPDITKKDGSIGQIPKPCHNLDMESGAFDKAKRDPYFEHRDQLTNKGEPGTGFRLKYVTNLINRDRQEEGPPAKAKPPTAQEEETGFKDPKSKTFTIYDALEFPKTLLEKIQGLKSRNVVKTKKGKQAFSVDHPRFGRDIMIKFNANASTPAAYWDVSIADDSKPGPITEEEKEGLLWDIPGAITKVLSAETLEQADAWVAAAIGDDDETPKKKKGKQTAKKSSVEDDDDEDEEDGLDDEDYSLDDDEDEEDEEPAPKKKKKSPPVKKSKSSKKKPVVEEDDEDDEDEDDDFDLDSDDEDEDEEDEEPAPKKKSKTSINSKPVKSKKKPVVEEEEDDEEDDDFDLDEEDDEEDEPAPKKKKVAAKPVKGKSKKPVVEEDEDDEDEDEDDDFDLDDEDEDEEDEEPAPKKKLKSKKRR